MMRILILFLFFSISASAQVDGIFYFAVTDGVGNKILPSAYWKVSASIKDGDLLPIQFSESDTAYILALPKESFNKLLQIQLAYSAGSYTGIMNVYGKIADTNGNGACNTCAITNMEYRPGNFMLDLPYQQASWDFLDTINCAYGDKNYTLKNISMLQNWSEPNLK
ncbi:MAG: hypothetical protein WAU21_15620 [Chitinophagales bacterium]|nr:hypothetical protein [Bacteroidota bacterium]MBK8488659.1 hypothetical protein [Bacteroidota bacterium]